MIPVRLLAAAAALLLTAQAAAAHAYRLGAVAVDHPWSRPAAAGMTGVGYMAIRNTGRTPVVLTGATTPLAGRVSLHRTTMAGGVMRMTPVGPLTIAPGATVTLAPAGYHLMLERLNRPLTLGQRAPLILTFSDGRKLSVELAVEATRPAASMPGMKH